MEPSLATDLVETMRVSPGCVGLVVLFDPELVHAEGGEVRREGCMSVPDWTLDGLLILDRVASLTTDVFRRKAYQPPRDPIR